MPLRGAGSVSPPIHVFVLAVALFAAVCAALSFLAPVTFAHVPAIASRAVRFRVFGFFNLYLSCSLCLERRGVAKFLARLSKASGQATSELRIAFQTWLRSESPLHLIIFASVLAIAVGARLAYLFEPIQYDEAFTYLVYARHPLWDGISNYSAPNNHLFNTALVHLCVRIFGGSEWALRLPALLAGVGIVPATYLLARRLLFDKNGALMSAAVSAASVPLIYYSVSARGYALLVLVSLLLFALCTKAQQCGSEATWAAIVLASAVGFAVMPTMLFPYATAMVWTICNTALSKSRSLRMVIKEISIASVCILVLAVFAYSPAMLRTGPKSIVANRFVRPLDWSGFLKYSKGFPQLLWRDWAFAIPSWLLVIFLLGFALSLIRYKQAFKSVLLLPTIVVMAGALCLALRVVPSTRVFLYVVPVLVIYSCAGVCILLRFLTRSLPVAPETLVPVASLVFSALLTFSVVRSAVLPRLNDLAGFRRASEVVGFLRSLGPNQKIIALPPCDAPLEYYAKRQGQTFFWTAADTPGTYFIAFNESSSTLVNEIRDSSFLTLNGIRSICGIDNRAPTDLVKRFGDDSIYAVEGRGSPCGVILQPIGRPGSIPGDGSTGRKGCGTFPTLCL
jgi:Dolichyl-phosphate-mannose-protein mannosyltransferase